MALCASGRAPPSAGQILIDGVPRKDWGIWTNLPTGSHSVCFGLVTGRPTPACQNVTVDAGARTSVTGTYGP